MSAHSPRAGGAEVIPLDRARPPSDEVLVRRAQAGDRAAFDRLVERYQREVVAVAVRRLGDRELALEAAQETFVDLYRALARYQERGKLRPYLFTLLLNRCRMAHRGQGRRRRAMASLAIHAAMAEPGAAPDAAVLEQEQKARVWRAVAELDEKLRAVVELRMAGQLPLDEIAAALGIPVGTVKSRLSAALVRVREALEGA